MESKDDERKSIQQLPDNRQQKGLANLLARGNEFHLCYTVHGIDVIHAFSAILIALVHAIDTDVAGHVIRLWRTALSDGDTRWMGLAPMPSLVLVRRASAQVVQMGNRDARQALETQITKHLRCPLHELLGGRAGQGSMQHI